MQLELDFPLSHQPVNPPRENHPEKIYADTWAAWAMAQPSRAYDAPDATNFDWMFSDVPWAPGQQEARVAASLMCWLGANCGQGFLDDVRRLQAAIGVQYPLKSVFAMQWAKENQRNPCVNHGIRILEFCLTPRARLNADEFGERPQAYVELSGRDYEAAECVMRWLGTFDGQQFLHACRNECDHAETRERAARRSARMG